MRTYLFIISLIFFGWASLLNAESTGLGQAYPKSQISDPNISLARFIAHRRPISDRSLVVLVRENQFYVLGDANSRPIFDRTGLSGDIVLLESAAESFLAWKKLNPSSPVAAFLADQSISPNEQLNYAEEIKKTLSANEKIQSVEKRCQALCRHE